jgi:cysteine-rich repeat protein
VQNQSGEITCIEVICSNLCHECASSSKCKKCLPTDPNNATIGIF